MSRDETGIVLWSLWSLLSSKESRVDTRPQWRRELESITEQRGRWKSGQWLGCWSLSKDCFLCRWLTGLFGVVALEGGWFISSYQSIETIGSQSHSPVMMGTAEPFSCNEFQRSMKVRLCWVAPTGTLGIPGWDPGQAGRTG